MKSAPIKKRERARRTVCVNCPTAAVTDHCLLYTHNRSSGGVRESLAAVGRCDPISPVFAVTS